jgi:hypothetical protein
MIHVLKIETKDKKVAERITEFAEEIGATVKRSKSAKVSIIEKTDVKWVTGFEPTQTNTPKESGRLKNPENSTEVNIQDLKKLFGIK